MNIMAQHNPHHPYADHVQPGFEHLIRHHPHLSYAAAYSARPESPFAHPGRHSPSLNSPHFQQNSMQHLQQAEDSGQLVALLSNANVNANANANTGMDMAFYGAHAIRPAGEADFYQFTHGQPPNDQMVPRSLPDNRQNRNSRGPARSHSPQNRSEAASRVTKASRSKKSSKTSAKAPQLDGPLSELTKDMSIPIRDMQEWVNRPLEVRLKEVEKRNGYVTRPMNSFMLYRSAYAERTKQFCIQNNHQVVSAVSGQSWPKEPAEVRDFYNHLARVERDNHARAHPSYKFSPSKAVTASYARNRRKTLGSDAESDDDYSEADADADQEWVPRGRERKTGRVTSGSSRRSAQETHHGHGQPMQQSSPLSASPATPAQRQQLQHQLQHQQQWNYQAGAAPMPLELQMGWHMNLSNQDAAAEQFEQYHNQQQQQQFQLQQHYQQMLSGPYYQQQQQQQQQQQHDLSQMYQSSAMVGLPSGDFFVGMAQRPFDQAFESDFQLDPMLLQFEHQQTPPLDDPATPSDDFDDVSPLGRPGGRKTKTTAAPPKRSSLALARDARDLLGGHQHDMPNHSFEERQGEFDGWMELAPPAAPFSP